jgi:hypothetical protein
MAVNDLVFRDLGHGLVVLTLLTAIRKLKFSTSVSRWLKRCGTWPTKWSSLLVR